MQSSAIDSVRQAEKDADEVLRHAAAEAERIVEEARVQAIKDDRNARLNAAGIAESVVSLAKRQAEEANKRAQEALSQELSALEALGTERRQAAVERILRLITGR